MQQRHFCLKRDVLKNIRRLLNHFCLNYTRLFFKSGGRMGEKTDGWMLKPLKGLLTAIKKAKKNFHYAENY